MSSDYKFDEYKKVLEGSQKIYEELGQIYRDVIEAERVYYSAQTPEDKSKLRMTAPDILNSQNINERNWGVTNISGDEIASWMFVEHHIIVVYETAVYSRGCFMGNDQNKMVYPEWLIDAFGDEEVYQAALRRFVNTKALEALALWQKNYDDQRRFQEEKQHQKESNDRALYERLHAIYGEQK